MIGDVAHPMPILGGEGANQVITDAFDLAEHLLNLSTSKKSVFLERKDRDWRTAVHETLQDARATYRLTFVVR